MLISVQQQDFDVSEIAKLLCAERNDIGAIVSFSGMVRDQSPNHDLVAMELEHYPVMTQKAIESIAQQAVARWEVQDIAIIHRVGRLEPADNIVLVMVISPHRKAAFAACEFIMDYLKTQAPFWKKEITRDGEHWVDAKLSDEEAIDKWEN